MFTEKVLRGKQKGVWLDAEATDMRGGKIKQLITRYKHVPASYILAAR